MSEMNNLQKALLVIEEERSHKYDDLYETPKLHEFSQRYLLRRGEIISMYERRQVDTATHVPTNRRARKIRLRTILVAALIMLLATTSVIAITKPHIYYVIKEKIDSWKITFTEEGGEDIESDFEVIKPQIPDGFKVDHEEELENNYFLSLTNSTGKIITYEQIRPEGTSIRIDSEHSDNISETINGLEVVISKTEQTTTLICNDGEYIYQIYGDANEDLLREMMMKIIEK